MLTPLPQLRDGLCGVAAAADGQLHHSAATPARALRQRLQHRLELISLDDGECKPSHGSHSRPFTRACESFDPQNFGRSNCNCNGSIVPGE